MKILDFIGQTLLLTAALFCLLLGKEAMVFIALIQFFMGGWQLLSAIIITAYRKHGDVQRTLMIRIYWISVLIYFLGLTFFGLFSGEKELMYIWFFGAWLIAIYYYMLTIRLAFLSKERKTFLDIAN